MESVDDARERLRSYLRQRAEYEAKLRKTKDTDSRLRSMAKHAVPPTVRGKARIAATNLLATRERRRAAALAGHSPLLLHLGSGGEPKPGWVNMDLIGDPVEVAWNMARPLPFDSRSVDGIFHEHMLECLPIEVGSSFLGECYRVLRSGGVLRVAVPDAGLLVQSCADGGSGAIEETRPGRPTPLLAMQEIFYWYYHVMMYDFATLELVLRASGFEEIEQKSFGDTSLPECPDTPSRAPGTLYVDARK
jgi:predicted SAM-dependent methyltransferase